MRMGFSQGAALGAVFLSLAAGVAALPAKGKPAPAWSGRTVQGKELKSTQLKGRVVLMNFFNNY
jgi:hypothetical protein